MIRAKQDCDNPFQSQEKLDMRKIVAGEFVSLDGVMEAPDQWHFPYFNDEMGEAVGKQMANSDAMLLGRVTWEEFASFWPNATDEETGGMTTHMNDTPKYVVSTTLNDVSAWQNSTLIQGDVLTELARLKETPGKDIGITGSATLVQSLLEAGLLDELNLLVHPIVVGHGKRLFRQDAATTGLELVESKTFSTGVLALTYVPARSS
jgi:dihydrofolate reductase